jgi:hypothetical protein
VKDLRKELDLCVEYFLKAVTLRILQAPVIHDFKRAALITLRLMS